MNKNDDLKTITALSHYFSYVFQIVFKVRESMNYFGGSIGVVLYKFS